MIAVEIIFIASLALMAYACLGYPMLVFAMSILRPRPVKKADIAAKVSVIIAAHNEEADIAAKIENTLALDYPKEKLEIIVVSDCSSDRTDQIVLAYADRGVRLHRQQERRGKTMAQNSAVAISSGEILVFTDATTTFESDVVRKIVPSFADPEVGCVGGQLVYVDRSKTSVGQGCSSYWGYEKFIKSCESRAGSLIGVSGCLYAVRRCNYTPLAQDMSSDFVIASDIHLKGLRTVYEPEAICTEDTNHRGRDEFRMRVRVIEQTMSAMSRYREALSLRKHGMFAFQMISHKVLRYALPAMLLTAFASNLLLVNESEIYRVALAPQLAFGLAALGGWVLARLGTKLGVWGLPYYFALGNIAIIVGFWKFVRGETHVVWEPLRESKGSQLYMEPARAGGEPGIAVSAE